MKVRNALTLVLGIALAVIFIDIGMVLYHTDHRPVISQPQHTLTDDEIIGRSDTVAARTARRVQDDLDLCTKPYPGPGAKADCDAARKLLFQEGFRSM